MTQPDVIIGVAALYLLCCAVALRKVEHTLLHDRLSHHFVPVSLLLTASAVAVRYVLSSLLLLFV